MLGLAWLGLAAWQWHEYRHECDQARRSIERQADTFNRVLVGSVLSHRRVGTFFDEMVQGALERMAQSEEILAVGIAEGPRGDPPELLLASGDPELLTRSAPDNPTVYRFVDEFVLEPPSGGHGGGGLGSGVGMGLGGGGRGRGRGAGGDLEPGLFRPGATSRTILVLDSSETLRQLNRAYRLRLLVVLAGGVVLALLSFAWLTTVRLVETRSEARLLASEAEHLHEMSRAAAGLAHETRNPLGLVRGWTQRLAQSESASPDQRRQARAVIEECDRVTARINQFLSFARPCQPNREAVDLEPLADELAAILQPDLEAKELRIETRFDLQPARVEVDREMFRQALFNLVSNAIEFSPRAGAIEIRLVSGGEGRPRVEVADSGPGVPAENVDSLFVPYFTTRPSGTGLGLAIVRRIARAHGWKVGYQPRPGGGSVFWLEEADAR